MDSLIIPQKARKYNGYFEKTFEDEGKFRAEVACLQYFGETGIFRVPRVLAVDEEKFQVRMDIINGISVLAFLRRSQLLLEWGRVTEDKFIQISGFLLQDSLATLKLYQSISKDVLNQIPEKLQRLYPYEIELNQAFYAISRFLDVEISDTVMRLGQGIADMLVKNANVSLRDIGGHNQIIKLDDVLVTDEKIEQFYQKSTIEMFEYLKRNIYHIDFELANLKTCHFDDFIHLVYEYIYYERESALRKILMKSDDSFVLGVIFRRFRCGARRVEYLFTDRLKYYEQYERWGAAKFEHPLYYFSTCMLALNNTNGEYLPLEKFLQECIRSLIERMRNEHLDIPQYLLQEPFFEVLHSLM